MEADDAQRAADDTAEEGWFVDPFGRHEARWLSLGKPTRLVRDGGVESYDDPPNEESVHHATRIDETAPAGGVDLRRADDNAGGSSDLDQRMSDAALEAGAHPMID